MSEKLTNWKNEPTVYDLKNDFTLAITATITATIDVHNVTKVQELELS